MFQNITFNILPKATSIKKATLKEQNIYGANRIGIIAQNKVLVDNSVTLPVEFLDPEVILGQIINGVKNNKIGQRRYEITNYLGNVNAVITDRRSYNANPSLTSPYEAVVVNTTDYYPFGMQMPERHYSNGNYRYAYNGMEVDPEMKGPGNSYTTEFRQYDPRLGRWLSLDPLMAQFPWMSPYVAFDNNPVFFIDKKGDYSIEVIKRDDGKMELRITTIGYVKGELADKMIQVFYSSYPKGYSDEGKYIDQNGTEWIISVKIDLKNISEKTGNEIDGGCVVDSDCLPPVNMLEFGVQGGSNVCAGDAGLALHGIWHTLGGDDCYNEDGKICTRNKLLDNTKIRQEDFWQIGYQFIENVPENINNASNKSNYSLVDFILKKTKDDMISSQNNTNFWWNNSFPKGIDALIDMQISRQLEKNPIMAPIDMCNPRVENEELPTDIDKTNIVIFE